MALLEQKGLDPGQLARIRNYLELRLEAFRRMIRQHVERELERRAWRQGEKLTREVLADKPLFALTPDEVGQMKTVVARRLFGETPAPKPAGIAVLTDSDDTRSTASGDHANFRACRP
jgi:hypothetical protein